MKTSAIWTQVHSNNLRSSCVHYISGAVLQWFVKCTSETFFFLESGNFAAIKYEHIMYTKTRITLCFHGTVIENNCRVRLST